MLNASNITIEGRIDSLYNVLYSCDKDSESKYPNEQYRAKICKKILKKFEESCPKHILITLGYSSKSTMYDYDSKKSVPIPYQRCLCCGKRIPYGIVTNTIDATDFLFESNDYKELDNKFLVIIKMYLEFSKQLSNLDDKEKIILFKDFIENYKNNMNEYFINENQLLLKK